MTGSRRGWVAETDACLERLEALIWSALDEGRASGRHPFRLPSLATVGPSPDAASAQPMAAEARTVVLRGVHRVRREVWCHTDRRSAKWAAVQFVPYASWLFYHPADGVQIRLSGKVVPDIGSAQLAQHWQAVSAATRPSYFSALAPGAPLPAGVSEVQLDSVQPSSTVPDNFAVLTTVVEGIDFLELAASASARANVRARFRYSGGKTTAEWCAP